MTLKNILSGKAAHPRRILLYGTAGVGKSSWAATAPKPVFVPTEDGLGDIGCDRFPVLGSLDEVMRDLASLYEEEHDYRTVVVDSADWLERLIHAEVCTKRGVSSIEDIGYGKGYHFALSHWKDVLDGLDALRSAIRVRFALQRRTPRQADLRRPRPQHRQGRHPRLHRQHRHR